jgi:hypothetical protein
METGMTAFVLGVIARSTASQSDQHGVFGNIDNHGCRAHNGDNTGCCRVGVVGDDHFITRPDIQVTGNKKISIIMH